MMINLTMDVRFPADDQVRSHILSDSIRWHTKVENLFNESEKQARNSLSEQTAEMSRRS